MLSYAAKTLPLSAPLCPSLQTLLSLGASPDYKDRRGLTPLYHTVLTGGETSCCETLLYHHAKLGIRDENGWDETHQVRYAWRHHTCAA